MKKVFKSLLSTLTIGSTVVSVASVCTSCGSKEVPEDTFVFSFDEPYIMPKQSRTAECRMSGRIIENTNVEWQLINPPYDLITIDEEGVLSVPELPFPIGVPLSFDVVGTLKSDPSLTYTLTVSLVADSQKKLIGFVDNKVSYVNRASQLEDIELEQQDEHTYVNKTPINLFTNDVLPPQYTSWIDFTPIIKSECEQEMYFEYGYGVDQHSIQWSNYENGTMTKTIPMFNTISLNNPIDYIKVTFECDPTVSLILKLNIWTRKNWLTAGVFGYEPASDADPLFVLPYTDRGDGAFYSNMPCKVDDGVYTGTYSTIYCCRKPHEFLEYDIKMTNVNKKLLEAGAFKIWSDGEDGPYVTKYVRPSDNYHTYIISFHYEINGELLAEYRWKRLQLFTIEASDSLKGTLACYCDFWVGWYE